MPQDNKTSLWLAIIPYIFQAFCLLLLTIILVVGNPTPIAQAVVSALLVVGTGSAIAGGSTVTAHIIRSQPPTGS